MKLRKLSAVAAASLLAASIAPSARAEDVMTLHATSGELLHGGVYPADYLFLRGLDPASTQVNWVDKPYKAVLDIEEGPEKGQSVVVSLVPTTAAVPNPEWCDTEGGTKLTGGGVTCKPGEPSKKQLRYLVRVMRADDLPKAFAGRNVAEYPNLPGRREGESLGRFQMKIALQE